jgi:hypothetical protein
MYTMYLQTATIVVGQVEIACIIARPTSSNAHI